MKITKSVETVNRKTVTKFFVDTILVAVCYQYKEFYCTVDRQGRPSNIRDRVKNAKETRWDLEGLKQLLGDAVSLAYSASKHSSFRLKKTTSPTLPLIFKDDYPDLTWGYVGSILSPKKIKEAFEAYKQQQTIS